MVLHNLFAFSLKLYNNKFMKKKKIIIIAFILAGLMIVLIGYLIWSYKKADYYAKVSHETSNRQTKILDLEKSITLWPKASNIIALSDLYIASGRNDLAEQIMVGRGDPQILNKLGNLYLSENQAEKAEKAFVKANNKKINSDSLKGLVLTQLKKGDRGEAEKYLGQLANLDQSSANCYASFMYLNNFDNAKKYFTKAKSCNLYGLDKYFATFNSAQNPFYLKLEASNLYYQNNYLQLALKDVLALEKEKENYRDAHILASKIYERLGNQTLANEQIQKVETLDPAYPLN